MSANKERLKILALDGGGVKGLSSLLILERIMARVGAKMKRPDLQPYQYFDIIGGTSTGGIIALMLGRMRMTVESCIAEYQKLGKIVFGEPRGLFYENMFDAKVLEEQTKKVVEKYLGDENDPLLDPLGDDACKTCSVVYTLPYRGATPEEPEALRTYINVNINPRPKPWTIWEAVRATSAATTIFEPFIHGQSGSEIRYIDAGLGFNNPADLVLEEATSLWTDNGYLDPERDIGCFLTIGTGISSVTRMDKKTITEAITAKVRKPVQAIEVLMKIATGTGPTHRNVARRFNPTSNVYQRFDVDQGIEAFNLFDHERREDIEVDTNAYLRKHSIGVQLSQAIEKMKVLGLRTPELMGDRKEGGEVYSVGENGDVDDQKLRDRFEALRISKLDFQRHAKHWESKISVNQDRGSQYYYLLYKEIGHVPYLWNAFVQADLLDKRYRGILARRLPQADEWQLCLRGNLARIAYGVGQEDLKTTVTRLTLAYDGLRDTFRIYRQLFHTAQQVFGETSVTYCWAAKRLGALLELWGCQSEALDLYIEARAGKLRWFKTDHWSTKWLENKIAALRHALVARQKPE
ncbi:hypothetical protein ABZX51_004221 [Aspergillus tubingensis]